ncbi:MAG: HEAT repeat domain-containing protein [Acidobacteria bacterium]|nr:HEAT repeat domain-containing protein [Acidobacteriota bacterium]
MPTAGATVLPELLQELFLAWKACAAYPDEHPAARRAAERAHQGLAALIGREGELMLGVVPGALLSGGERLQNAAAARLASALHEREVAVLRVRGGASVDELLALFQLLTPRPGGGDPEPLAAALARRGVVGIEADAIQFAIEPTGLAGDGSGTGRAPEGWEDIVATQLDGAPAAPDATAVSARVPPAIAGALSEACAPALPGAATRDEVLHGPLLQLAGGADLDRTPPSPAEPPFVPVIPPAMGPRETPPPEVLRRIESLSQERQIDQLSQLVLELLPRVAADAERRRAVCQRIDGLVRTHAADGRLDVAIEFVARIAQLGAGAALESLAEVVVPEVLVEATAKPDPGQVRRLGQLLGARFFQRLLRMLGDESDRARRWRVFELLSGLGPDVVPHASAMLRDPRWFVVRNVLSLMRTVRDATFVGEAQRLLGHAHPRVRLEALRLLVELNAEIPVDAVRALLRDADPRLSADAALMLAKASGRTAADELLRLLDGWDVRGQHTAARAAALQALGQLGDRRLLPKLGRFFRTWSFWVSLAERRAAWASLDGYPEPERSTWARRGLRAKDPEIRRACERILLTLRGREGAP